jgi:glycosyltransferase involved in cell wall biosynthesis
MTDPRIHIFQTPANTGGPAAPRNLAISHAKGEYIAILDQDDLWEPDKLEKQVAFLEKHPDIGLLSSNLRLIDLAGRENRRRESASRVSLFRLPGLSTGKTLFCHRR